MTLLLTGPYLVSGKKRKPAWTDRILWRVKPKSLAPEDDDDSVSTLTDDGHEDYPIQVHQDNYTSNMSYGVSDHKPVLASFRLEVKASRQTKKENIKNIGF